VTHARFTPAAVVELEDAARRAARAGEHGSSLSARNLSSTVDQSAILMSLRRCARNSAWS